MATAPEPMPVEGDRLRIAAQLLAALLVRYTVDRHKTYRQLARESLAAADALLQEAAGVSPTKE